MNPAGQSGPSTLVIGYGTLLCPESLRRTIGATATGGPTATPVVVRGFKRLFNLRPDHYPTSDVLGEAGIENGAMNVEPAAGSSFNGVAFRVTRRQLAELDLREYAYDRLRVEAHDFATGAAVGPGHVYSSAQDASWIERDPRKLLPLWRDLAWARACAYQIGRRFGVAFDETTYLADGTTLAVARYRGLLVTAD